MADESEGRRGELGEEGIRGQKGKTQGTWTVGGRLKGTEDMAFKGRDEGDSAEEKPRYK